MSQEVITAIFTLGHDARNCATAKKKNHITTFYLFFPPKAGSDSKFELLVMQFMKSDS